MPENISPQTRFQIVPNKKNLHLQVQVFVPITNDLVACLVRAMVKSSREHHLKKHLLDLRGVAQAQKAYQLYDPIHHELLNFSALFKFQIAVLISSEAVPPDFIKTLFEHNSINAKVFVQEVDALNWLREKG